MEIISGTFYRCDSEVFLKAKTALDVLEYEAYELCNKDAMIPLMQIKSNHLLDLGSIPASRLLWVTRTKTDALRYARDEDGNDVEDISLVDEYVQAYNVQDAQIIIPDDGDGGMLLLLSDNECKTLKSK